MKSSAITILFLCFFISIYAQKEVNDVNRFQIGDAANINSAMRVEAKTISYNEDLNLISASFILDPNSYSEVEEMGTIGFFYSSYSDNIYWEDPLILYNPNTNSNNLKSDFPSAILFNPEGNSDPLQAFAVAQSPVFDEEGKAHKLFAVSRLDGQESNAHIIENTGSDEDGYWNQFGLCQAGNEVKCLNVITEGSQNAWTALSLQPIRGIYTDAFEWDDSQVLPIDLYQFSDNNNIAWGGQLEGHDSGVEMAWSLDGEIGYMWVLGVENEFFTGYQPIIYNTIDGGETWSPIRLDFQHPDYQAVMQDYTLASESGSIVPHVFESAGVVDKEGHLQMIVAIVGTSSDLSVEPDSVANHYDNPGDLYQLSAYSYGLCQFTWIDSLRTKNTLSSTEGNYADSIGWQHRLTASRVDSEKGIFFTWIDTENSYNQIENLRPDLFMWIYCHSEPNYNNSGTINYTAGSLYESFYFFTNTCDQAIYDNDIFAYSLPVLQALSPADYADNGVNEPVTFSYVSGLDYDNMYVFSCSNQSQCLLTRNDNLFEPSHFEMTQNAPNPFSTETTIRIISQKQISGTLELHDLLGQKMMEIETGPIYGSADFIISSENLRSGIYFYSFVSGNIRVSKKMIINPHYSSESKAH